MPVYQYRDQRTGGIVELLKPVAERDNVAAGLARIAVPQKVMVVGGAVDPQSPDGSVPRAIRQMEATMSARDIARGSGFTVNQFKKIWNL